MSHLLSRPCKRRLKTAQRVRLNSENERSLKTSKATDDSLARVSRGTRRGLDFEFREPNPKLKSGCNIWETSANTKAFLCLVESFLIGPERKNKKIDLFGLPYTTRRFSEKLEL